MKNISTTLLISKFIRLLLTAREEKPLRETPLKIVLRCLGLKSKEVVVESGQKKSKVVRKVLRGGEETDIEPGSFYSIINNSEFSTFVSLIEYKSHKKDGC